MLQLVLPRKHRNIFFFYVAASSMTRTGDVTSVKPLLCCKMCRPRSQLTNGQRIRAVPSVTAQHHHLRLGRKTRPKHGTCVGRLRRKPVLKTLPQQPPTPSKGLVLNEGQDSEHSAQLRHLLLHSQGHFQQVASHNLAGGWDGNNRTASEEAWPFSLSVQLHFQHN